MHPKLRLKCTRVHAPVPIIHKKQKKNIAHCHLSRNVNPVCEHCKATKTPLWRKSNSGGILCNACGIYWRVHGTHRKLVQHSQNKQHPPHQHQAFMHRSVPVKVLYSLPKPTVGQINSDCMVTLSRSVIFEGMLQHMSRIF